ncbi:MAG TPA: YihY/virulence factor BrkB family protein [Candidatus Baltobacteraceae bacterium]|nr:YihY/virulence factor BrkB family protein [Candidatus Baltobacteraceae bacterium]
MLREWLSEVWTLVKCTASQWSKHRSAEMASSLAFYGAITLAGLALVAVYAAARILGGGQAAANTRGQTGHIAGPHNAQVLDAILHQAALRHDAWIALAAGAVMFLVGVTATAFQLQQVLDVVWEHRGAAKDARRHAPQFAAIYALTLVLIVLLFAGAAVHALTMHTHHLPLLRGVLYQALVVGVTIIVLTFVFLFVFAYLPPVDIPWRKVWIASFISAVLYERGQFALSVYLGQMDARSPYADAGVLLAVLLWLYYSAQVVLVGADFTKVLKERGERRRVHSTG